MTILAFMKGWIWQWYGNVPALLSVIVFDEPGSRSPVSNAPPSAVIVWVVLSLLVTVTLAPVLTSSVEGLNLKSWIVTASEPPVAEAGLDGCCAAGVESLLLDPPQAETRAAIASVITRRGRGIDRP